MSATSNGVIKERTKPFANGLKNGHNFLIEAKSWAGSMLSKKFKPSKRERAVQVAARWAPLFSIAALLMGGVAFWRSIFKGQEG